MTLHGIITATTFALTCGAGSVLWIRTLQARSAGSLQFPGKDQSIRARWGLLETFGIGFLWLYVQAAVISLTIWTSGVPAEELLQHGELVTRLAFLSSAAQLVVTAMAFAWLCHQYRLSPADFGLGSRDFRRGIRKGASAFVMWVPLVWGIQFAMVHLIEYSHPSLEVIESHPGPWALLSVWFSAVIAAPIIEEFLFRGVLQGWMQRVGRPLFDQTPQSILLGSGAAHPNSEASERCHGAVPIHWPAIVATSLIFAAMHFSQGPAPVALFVLSIGLGYLYQRTGSLLACMVMHLMLNLVTMTLTSLEAAGF